MIGLLAFFHNLSVSLFGDTEGLYAAVTETMLRTGEYVHLTLNLKPYVNKPPMFFWLQGLSSQALGLNELALRLPSALFSLGTMIVTYWLGKLLFSRTAGFWASLVVGTSNATVWFGQMGIIDPVLTFFMTLGLLGFILAYFQKGSEWWYVLGFVALAFGAMVKNFHACAMPVLLFLVLLWVFRDGKPLQSLPFWMGCGVFAALLGAYYAVLGQTFWQHFFFQENLKRITMVAGDMKGSALEAYFGSRPILWYAYTIWFDFFPWSVLLPSSLILLWKQRPFRHSPREAFILFWVIGYFLAFSLFPEKHERYLLPLAPGLALWVGYVYHRVWSSEGLEGRETSVMKIMLGVLSVAFLLLVFLVPFILQKKWGTPSDVFPVFYQGIIVFSAGALLFFLYRSRLGTALNMVGVLAVAFMVGIVMFIVPAIDAGASPKSMFTEIRSSLNNPTDHIWAFQHWNWRTDEDLYYWQHVHRGALILGWATDAEQGLEVLKAKVKKKGQLVILMTENQYQQSVSLDPDLKVIVLKEFLRPKLKIFLVSVELNR
jgi:4-amino-4-deoxy-L-arabinose transferase-like glycosyltransferase